MMSPVSKADCVPLRRASVALAGRAGRQVRVRAQDRVARRAEVLERLLGGLAPGLVRWLPAIGVVLGLIVGGVVWLAVGSEIVLLREAVLGAGAICGLVVGGIERTRIGKLLLADIQPPDMPADLPSEFGHLPRAFDHREDAMARRDRM
jgi:hypothetical protein